MDRSTSFFLEHSGYSVERLTPEDSEIIQELYEQCIEFALLTDGLAFSPTAAR